LPAIQFSSLCKTYIYSNVLFKQIPILFCLFLCSFTGVTQQSVLPHVTEAAVGEAWSGNSVNTVVFRKNSLTSLNGTQFISYYDAGGFVMLGKRTIGQAGWELKKTRYKGNIADAHNSISIVLDGEGYLHMAWDHHGTRLRYCRSVQPYSLELTDEMPMTSRNEAKLSYPEFYRMPDGDLLFLYRDGSSGNGNLVINKYSIKAKAWSRLQDNLIDGEGSRNAYWQACVDAKGAVHISWVWRESPDVASNHDLCYAVSEDGGLSWENSSGTTYKLPVTQSTAEVIVHIPQQSELINQTSMYADEQGRPIIASYWKGKGGIPQYHLVYQERKKWISTDLGFRKTGFSLSGAGTKKIPVSRPQVIGWKKGSRRMVAILFRDEERGNKVSMATTSIKKKMNWTLTDLTEYATGAWEPSFDTDQWKENQLLHLFVQPVTQADAEGVVKALPTIVKVLECIF
jgi:hypothetical protein